MCDCLRYILLIADPFATELSLKVQYHVPGCCEKRLACCIQGQGHSEGLNFNDCPSRKYFLNHCTLCNQTWYGDTLVEVEFDA